MNRYECREPGADSIGALPFLFVCVPPNETGDWILWMYVYLERMKSLASCGMKAANTSLEKTMLLVRGALSTLSRIRGNRVGDK